MMRSTLLPRFDLVVEVVRRQRHGARDRREQPASERIERVVQAERRFAHAGNAVDPDVGRHHLRERMSRRQLATDVPELLEIVVFRALGGFDAEGRISPGAAAARHLEFALLGVRQRKEFAECAETLVDEAPVDPVIFNDDESVLGVSRRDVARELRAVGSACVECRYGVGHLRAIVPTVAGM